MPILQRHPAFGKMVTGDGEPYRYLVESIRKFPPPDLFSEMIRDAGFARVTSRSLTAALPTSIPPGRSEAPLFAALRHSLHLVHVGFVLMREGVFALIPKRQVPTVLHPLLWILAAMARRMPAIAAPGMSRR